jgi:hypothetical protein
MIMALLLVWLKRRIYPYASPCSTYLKRVQFSAPLLVKVGIKGEGKTPLRRPELAYFLSDTFYFLQIFLIRVSIGERIIGAILDTFRIASTQVALYHRSTIRISPYVVIGT